MHSSDDSVRTNVATMGHKPVLLREVVQILSPRDNEIYLDCTFGGGGHTRAILESANCKVVALDRDPSAEIRAENLTKEFGERFEFHPTNFSNLDQIQTKGYAGILFDFGVSSFQLDEAERGFSFSKDAELDMRMDTRGGMSALDYVNQIDEFQLACDLRDFGEEPRSKKIARAIVQARNSARIHSTKQLAEIIASAAPDPRSKIHPATRTFQAIRIRVNDELGEIETALPKAFEVLKNGGILAAISFHSLEDRITKRFFKKMAGRPESRFDNSFVQDRIARAQLLTRKPIEASDDEMLLNPRSRSAKLRALQKDEK